MMFVGKSLSVMRSSNAWFAGWKRERDQAFVTIIHEIIEDWYPWPRK